MSFAIIGDADKERLYCAGSFTKFLTTFVSLSRLAEEYDLNAILDDENFLNKLCRNPASHDFLTLFQKIIGSRFSIRDICSYYSGLPYTFDLSEAEMASVDAGNPFKHHSIPDEKTFLQLCQTKITPVYGKQSKFHYSEIAIIFLGYLMEKVYDISIESLYQKYIISPFNLKKTLFARKRPATVYTQDLSDKYDYPSIAILDHGFFCYSNGYYTTLNELKLLMEQMVEQPVFQHMVDIKKARAASNRLLNGLTVEIRLVNDDLIYGYEGLSFSGCSIWAYSSKLKRGVITFSNNEEEVYDIIYGALGSTTFDKVPGHTEVIYKAFLSRYDFNIPSKDVPPVFQGHYHRVKINEKNLTTVFEIAANYMIIRNPDEIRYDIVYVKNHYRIKGKDGVHGATVGLYQSPAGHQYMLFDGTLYQKIT